MSTDTSRKNAAPIIIKRKKIIQAAGHHGGAWKVAYADFVTAMMAFFMLMWLLNATTEKQRKGLADYFSPTVSISRLSSGGSQALMGNSIFAEDVLPQNGTGSTSLQPIAQTNEGQSKNIAPELTEVSAELEEVERVLLEQVVESENGNALMPHISTRITDEGFVLTLSDYPGMPLFTDEASITPALDELLELVAQMSEMVINELSIETHVQRFPIVMKEDPAWPMTKARSSAVHERLIEEGVSDRQVRRVIAHGDRKANRKNETYVGNNRIDIVFLR